jgi:hypothetical protein
MQFSCSAEILHVLAFWPSLALRSVYSLQHSQRYANLLPTSTRDHDSSFLQDMDPLDFEIYSGFTQILQAAQLFVLGPRLILSVREYHAKLVANSDTATDVASIAFKERFHVSTSSSV